MREKRDCGLRVIQLQAVSLRLRLVALDNLVDHELSKDQPGPGEEMRSHLHARRWVEDYIFLYQLYREVWASFQNDPKPASRLFIKVLIKMAHLERCLKWPGVFFLDFMSLDGRSLQALADNLWAGAPDPPPLVANRMLDKIRKKILRLLVSSGIYAEGKAFLERKRQEPPL